MSGRGKRKAKAVDEEKEAPEKEEKKAAKKKDEEEIVAVEDDDERDAENVEEEGEGDSVGDKQRLKIIKARRKQLLDDIRDEQNKTVAAAQERTARDRLQFLLQQSEIYTHFMKPDAVKMGGKGSAKDAASPARRTGRITEKEEDDLLLQESKTDTTSIQLTATPPFIKNAPMRDYQVAGLNWLVRLHDSGINGILADEMGLGKTLQTISFLGYLKHVRGIGGPHLVVTPKSTLGNWLNEVKRWCPSLKAIKLHGTQEERAEQKSMQMIPGEFDILVTTYEIAIKEKAAISKFHYRYIVVDEAHRIKNEQSVLSQVVRLYKVQNRLLLTGTPLQNNLHELWALLNFLLPEVFASSDDFDAWFDLQGGGDKQEVVEKLHMVLRPFLLRRLKIDVEKSLPPKREIKLFVGPTDHRAGLSEVQKAWYKKVLLRDIEAVNGGGGDGKGSRVRLLNIVMQLRKAANHPYLFDGAEPYPFTTGEHLITSSGKLVVLDKLLPKLKAQGSRVLIFSQMTRLLDILEDYMLMRKIDGSTAGTDRETQIDDFNAPNSSKFIFLLSTRAGGLGINLATADTVVLYDSDWNPQVDLQAQDRAHRIGQKKQVNVYRFVTEGTIEEKIIERAEMKLQLDALVIQQGRLVEQNKALNKDELLGMIKFGADQIFSGTQGTITDEDIDVILARGQQKTDEINSKLKNNVQRRLLDFSLDSGGSLYNFEGVDYAGKAGKSKLLTGWIEPPKRERKTAGYGVNEYYRNALRVGEPRKQGLPRPPKQPVIHDFQFYPPQLQTLLDKETAAFRKRLEWTKAKEEREKAEAEKKEGEGDKKEKKKDEEEEEPDFSELTADEETLKAKMLEQGLSTWNRRDFNAFIRGSEHYGRKAYSDIAKECERTTEDVKAYAHIFWSRGPKQIADWEKLAKRIEDGESRIQRREEMGVALDKKVARYKDPWETLKLNYGMKRGKQYIEEEDVFLVCMTQKLGYGNWDTLKVEIRKAWQFRFNWFLKSRSPLELQRRVDTLIRLIEKENDDIERAKRGDGPKKHARPDAVGPAPPGAGPGAKRRAQKEEAAAAAGTGGLSKRRRVPIADAGAS